MVAGLFVAGNTKLGSAESNAAILAQARGLRVAFMLIPLAAAGVLLIAKRRHYGVDVASADLSERRGADASPEEPARTAWILPIFARDALMPWSARSPSHFRRGFTMSPAG